MSLSLKIHFVDTKTYKMVQIPSTQFVDDTLAFLRTKFELPESNDYGLLFKDQRLWLNPAKEIQFYPLKYGDVLEYRKKHRVLKVKFMDQSMKSIMVDETLSIQKVVTSVCQRVGIANPDEYSFVRYEQAKEDLGSESRIKDNTPSTSDGTTWLNPDKTLREQLILETDTVLLKKKFFFSDQTIDQNDPIQLGLLYNQAVEMILTGKHPCHLDEAIQFAALQLQVLYGNHEPDKHKKQTINLAQFLPQEYNKMKNIDKSIFEAHKKVYGLSLLNSKFRYVQLSRSMKTFGITFFLVKERTKSKKLVPILLGVSKTHVIRMDFDTKQVLGEWKLTQIRRWANTSKTFTLDFGDFAESYYSVETTDGEAISQQIGGYIDIIMKNMKEKQLKAQENAALENVRPSVMRTESLKRPVTSGQTASTIPPPKEPLLSADAVTASNKGYSQNSDKAKRQKELIRSIENGVVISESAKMDLSTVMTVPRLNDDPSLRAWKAEIFQINSEGLSSLLSGLLGTVSTLIVHATGNVDEMEYDTLGANVNSLVDYLRQGIQSLKLIAGLHKVDEGDALLQTGRRLADSSVEVLSALQNIVLGETFMDKYYSATGNLADSASTLLETLGKLSVPESQQQEIIQAAEALANSSLLIQGTIEEVSKKLTDSHIQQELLAEAYNVVETGSMLVALAEVLSPVIDSPHCRDQYLESLALMEDAISLPELASVKIDDHNLLKNLTDAIEKARTCLSQLVDKIRNDQEEYLDEIEVIYENVNLSCFELTNFVDNRLKVIDATKNLMVQLKELSTLLQNRLQSVPDDSKAGFVKDCQSIENLSDDIKIKIKNYVKNWNNAQSKNQFIGTVEEVKSKVEIMAAPFIIASASKKLIRSLKSTLSSSNQLVGISRSAGKFNRNQASQVEISRAVKGIMEVMPSSIQALNILQASPHDHVARVVAVKEGKIFLDASEVLLQSCKVAVVTVMDAASQRQLPSAISQLDSDLNLLKNAISLAEQLRGRDEINSAIASLRGIQSQISTMLSTESAVNIVSDASLDSIQADIINRLQKLAGFLDKVSQNEVNALTAGDMALDITADYQSLAFLCTQLCAKDSKEYEQNSNLLNAFNSLGSSLEFMLQAIQKKLQSGESGKESIQELIKGCIISAEGFSEFLPAQRIIFKLLETCEEMSGKMMNAWDAPGSVLAPGQQSLSTDTQSIMSGLKESIGSLITAANGLSMAPSRTIQQLKDDSQNLDSALTTCANASISLSFQPLDTDYRNEIQNKLFATCDLLSEYLTAVSNSLSMNATGDAMSELSRLSKAAGDSLNSVIDALSLEKDIKFRFLMALAILDEAYSLVSNVNGVSTVSTTFNIILNDSDQAAEHFTNTVTRLKGIGQAEVDLPMFSTDLASAVKRISDIAVRAAHFVVSTDPATVPFKRTLVDHLAVSNATKDLKAVCQEFSQSEISRESVLAAASEIARLTGVLASITKASSQDLALSTATQKQFFKFAKEISYKTANLVLCIKELAMQENATGDLIQSFNEASSRLLQTAEHVAFFTGAAEFAGNSSVPGDKSLSSQQKVVDITHNAILNTRDLIMFLKVQSDFTKAQVRDQAASKIEALMDSIELVTECISHSVPLQTESNQAKQNIGHSIALLKNAPATQAENPQETFDSNTKKILVESAESINNAGQMMVESLDKDDKDTERVASFLSDLSSNFANASLSLSQTVFSLEEGERDALLKAFDDLGSELLELVDRIQTAYCVPESDSRLTAFKTQAAVVQQSTSQVVGLLLGLSSKDTGDFQTVLSQIEKTITFLGSLEVEFVPSGSFSDYISQIQNACMQLEGFNDYSRNALSSSGAATELANEIPGAYTELSNLLQGASTTSDDDDLKAQLLDAQRKMGGLLMNFVVALRSGQEDQVSQASQKLQEGIDEVKKSVQLGIRGLSQLEKSCKDIDGLVEEIDRNLRVTATGQLNPVGDEPRSTRKDSLLASIRQLRDSQYQFSNLQQLSQKDLEQLSIRAFTSLEVVNHECLLEAINVSSADQAMQEQLLKCVLGVSTTLKTILNHSVLFLKSQNAGGKDSLSLQMAIMNGIDATESLVQLSYAASERTSYLIKAIDSALSAISRATVTLQSDAEEFGLERPGDLLVLVQSLEDAAKALSQSPLEEETSVVLVNYFKLQAEKVLAAVKACVEGAPDEIRQTVVGVTVDAAKECTELLVALKQDSLNSSSETRGGVEAQHSDLVDALAKLSVATGKLEPDGYADKADPNLANEQDLANLAADLEVASRHLVPATAATECPSLAVGKGEDGADQLEKSIPQTDGQIGKAVKNIALAIASLLKASISSQREIVARGRKLPPAEAMYFSDGKWSEGIISAAKEVGHVGRELCALARDMASASPAKNGDLPLRFIAASKQVSASTVQILTASAVHSDPYSKSQIQLQASAKHLMSSTEYLVKLCEESKLKDQMEAMDGGSESAVSASLTKLQADEMDAQVGILKMEQDLERARLKLAAVRKVRYSVARGNSSGGSSSSSSGALPMLSPIKVSPFTTEGASPTSTLSVSSARGLLLGSADQETRSQVLDFARRVSQIPSPPVISPLTMSPLSATASSLSPATGGFLAVKASDNGRRPTTRNFVTPSNLNRQTSIFLSGGANRPGIGSVASALKSKSPINATLPALPKLAKVVLQVLDEEGSLKATDTDTSEAVS